MALNEGEILAGKYRIERLLGEGGMGAVYVVTNTVLQKRVAMKVMSERFAAVPAAVERFLREAVAASRVSHPSIVQVFDAGEHEGAPWIAMEMLEGESLGERLERGPMSVQEVLDMADGVLSALAEVHDDGIIHRDLEARQHLPGAPAQRRMGPEGPRLRRGQGHERRAAQQAHRDRRRGRDRALPLAGAGEGPAGHRRARRRLRDGRGVLRGALGPHALRGRDDHAAHRQDVHRGADAARPGGARGCRRRWSTWSRPASSRIGTSASRRRARSSARCTRPRRRPRAAGPTWAWRRPRWRCRARPARRRARRTSPAVATAARASRARIRVGRRRARIRVGRSRARTRVGRRRARIRGGRRRARIRVGRSRARTRVRRASRVRSASRARSRPRRPVHPCRRAVAAPRPFPPTPCPRSPRRRRRRRRPSLGSG